jgi:hypothetical protein
MQIVSHFKHFKTLVCIIQTCFSPKIILICRPVKGTGQVFLCIPIHIQKSNSCSFESTLLNRLFLLFFKILRHP